MLYHTLPIEEIEMNDKQLFIVFNFFYNLGYGRWRFELFGVL